MFALTALPSQRNVMHMRSWGPVAAPGDEIVQALSFAFGEDLHRTVGTVSYPSFHAQSIRLCGRSGPKEYPLDPALDPKIDPNHIRQFIHIST